MFVNAPEFINILMPKSFLVTKPIASSIEYSLVFKALTVI